jgi:MoaA/NifB/PqqE/SkfB family radical SAM enzyme
MGKNRRREITLPRLLTYIVTFTCNARCIMCDCWKKESPEDLSLDEIERIFDQLPRLDAVRLTGGEPFVRQDFPEIARLAQEKLDPLLLHVTTNGFLTSRILQFCERRDRAKPLLLLVSMDGTKEKHNEVRGRVTAWDTTLATIKALAPRRKELNISLSVNQTIVDAAGIEEYRKLREFLKPLEVRNQVVMAYGASSTYGLEQEIDTAPTRPGQFDCFGSFKPADIQALADEIEKDLAGFPWRERLAKRYYLRGIRNRLLHAKGSPNPPCVALNSHLRLYPNGDVPTCQFNSRRVGNLRRQPFHELWHSQSVRRQREWVRKCPGCWAECEVLPSAIYTGDLLKFACQPGR